MKRLQSLQEECQQTYPTFILKAGSSTSMVTLWTAWSFFTDEGRVVFLFLDRCWRGFNYNHYRYTALSDVNLLTLWNVNRAFVQATNKRANVNQCPVLVILKLCNGGVIQIPKWTIKNKLVYVRTIQKLIILFGHVNWWCFENFSSRKEVHINKTF